jgi:hypothetical protein
MLFRTVRPVLVDGPTLARGRSAPPLWTVCLYQAASPKFFTSCLVLPLLDS